MRASLKWLAVSSLVLLLAACSRTGLLYDNADWLAYRWAVRLLDATAVQRDAWRERFRQWHDAHRRELLPDVIELLYLVETQVDRGLREEALDCVLDAFDRLYRRHASFAVPLASAVLSEVSTAQIEHMAAELERRNLEYAEQYLDDDLAERRRRRVERYLEQIERWTGDLTPGQVALIEQAIVAMPDTAGPWLDYRRAQQRRLLDLLARGPDRAGLDAFLSAWWVELADRPTTLVRQTERVRDASLRLALRLDASLTAEQRQTLVRRVAALRDDLEDAGEGDGRAARDGPASMICG